MTYILLIILIIVIYQLTKNILTTKVPNQKKGNKIRYMCQDCGHEFISSQNIEGCPNCSSNIVDELATIAGLWMLGDWMGFWGNDGDDISSSSDPFEDPWDDGSDLFDDEII